MFFSDLSKERFVSIGGRCGSSLATSLCLLSIDSLKDCEGPCRTSAERFQIILIFIKFISTQLLLQETSQDPSRYTVYKAWTHPYSLVYINQLVALRAGEVERKGNEFHLN